jgi:aromatic-amino-acid transaminase
VGVYYDDNGKVPVLECVRRAERMFLENPPARSYLPIDGIPAYDRAVQQLLFGPDSPALRAGRVVTVQALGGTGGLKIGTDFLRRVSPLAKVWISDPSWENHRALFSYAGYEVGAYPYYDQASRGVAFDAMMSTFKALPAGSIVVLHACCHNPTGADLTPEQWGDVIDVVNRRELVPFVDIAYQGFAEGLEPDAQVVRRFAATSPVVFISSSFSKSLSLYGERVGALSLVAGTADEAARALSQLKRVIRTNYSNPPTHGGQIVSAVLTTPELRALWEEELGRMRLRIRSMRQQLVQKVEASLPAADFGFVLHQRGMFSYSGLSKEAVTVLREKFSIYAIDTGRICVAALNARNIDYVADAIATVLH